MSRFRPSVPNVDTSGFTNVAALMQQGRQAAEGQQIDARELLAEISQDGVENAIATNQQRIQVEQIKQQAQAQLRDAATQMQQIQAQLLARKQAEQTARRGQDISAGVATRGQDIQAGVATRGQDLEFGSTVRGQDVQVRGQDVQAGIAGGQQGVQRYGIEVGAQTDNRRIDESARQSDVQAGLQRDQFDQSVDQFKQELDFRREQMENANDQAEADRLADENARKAEQDFRERMLRLENDMAGNGFSEQEMLMVQAATTDPETQESQIDPVAFQQLEAYAKANNRPELLEYAQVAGTHVAATKAERLIEGWRGATISKVREFRDDVLPYANQELKDAWERYEILEWGDRGSYGIRDQKLNKGALYRFIIDARGSIRPDTSR